MVKLKTTKPLTKEPGKKIRNQKQKDWIEKHHIYKPWLKK
jgi:hypothetical protein